MSPSAPRGKPMHSDPTSRYDTDYRASRRSPVSRPFGVEVVEEVREIRAALLASCARCRERSRETTTETHVEEHLDAALRVARSLFLVGW